eukprot:CAMPEP_0194047744 /NCGR_PEP_ID=MMETSP0009_2-20130614/25364_1 /TAXON_ID=210454 /ORGANISM="Grammatophora oceanica, Strain CCMP 410" /LENGTH=260 /DNA_ID=CAMNT_0038693437 /DNA_START=320 /DNA_END=1102 /DNA_ORIENTATION=+
MTVRAFFFNIKHLEPVLEDETNRHILSRHIGVDTMSCLIVSYMGWTARHIMQEMYDAVMLGRNNPKAMSKEGYEKRIFQYYPETARICVMFFAYQTKNMYDTIVWDDGPEFIFHHVLSMCVAWGAMYPGCAQFYGPFYLGMSEISTAVLCILANFDEPPAGVTGLADAYPITKVTVGAIFVTLFIICRCIIWPMCSYYFIRDCNWTFENKTHAMLTPSRGRWIRGLQWCLSGLSILQVAWLGQIFLLGKAELVKMGWIEE